MNALKRGDTGNLVSWYQQAINGWHDEFNHNPDRKIKVTAVFDAATETQVKAYQKSANVGFELVDGKKVYSGVIDGALAPALARFNPWYKANGGTIDAIARGQADAAHTRLDGLHAI